MLINFTSLLHFLRTLSFILFFVLLAGCSSPDHEAKKALLSGYWQIEKAEMPDGTEKEYALAPLVDYIEVKGDSGFRKKVSPLIDGTYRITQDTERIDVKIEEDSLHLYYRTPYDSWRETVLSADASTLVILNRDGKKFIYRRFENINIE